MAHKQATTRRRPRQRRARQTVDAILDAVTRVLKRQGPKSLTTNRIAEVAGVSIGSVYQYFPDKSAIFAALHERHIEQMDRLIAATLLDHAASPLDGLMRALIGALVDAHRDDPELLEWLESQVPHRAGGKRGFATRLHGVFRLAISARSAKLSARRDLDQVVSVVANMVDALSHAAALGRPPGVSLADAKNEAVRAVMAYLDS